MNAVVEHRQWSCLSSSSREYNYDESFQTVAQCTCDDHRTRHLTVASVFYHKTASATSPSRQRVVAYSVVAGATSNSSGNYSRRLVTADTGLQPPAYKS